MKETLQSSIYIYNSNFIWAISILKPNSKKHITQNITKYYASINN